jgi:ubiquinone/menaquinone biosynthesis C-methylase UbiE
MSSETTDRQQKDFLPAAGHDVFLPLYDPFVSFLGFDRARQELISQANIKPGQHILDVGCGTGTLALLLKRQYPDVEVVGLDPDPKALRRAKTKVRRAAVSVQLDQGFADELRYERESFDRVLSSFMFHHLAGHDREKTLTEVRRVLKPGGSFHLLDFVVDHAAHGFLHRLVHSHAELKDNTDERILQLLSRTGFANAQKVRAGSIFFGVLRTAYYSATNG